VIEAPLAERSPEALHLAAGLRILGLRVEQANAEPRAERLEHLASVRRAVVEVDRAGAPSGVAHRLHHQRKHLHLALRGRRLDRDDVPAVVVEDRVNS
jgi:hypothetical protein